MHDSGRVMPQSAQNAVIDESRTAAIGEKRPLNANSRKDQRIAQPNKRRRRNPVGERNVRDFVPAGSYFSSLANLDSNEADSKQDSTSDRSNIPPATMEENGLGHNRLKSGFHNSMVPTEGSSVSKESASEMDNTKRKSDEPIYVSDQETDEDIEDSDADGGMTLNLQGNSPAPIIISDDEDESEESGEILESTMTGQDEPPSPKPSLRNITEQTLQDDNEPSFIIDPSPSKPQTKSHTKLINLDPPQLEKQFRYAFWDLERHEVDLSRPAICLYCHAEGHIDENCPNRTCTNCGVYDQHDARLCPTVKRCKQCREPGHEGEDCMRNTTIPCDLCGLHGHIEDDCARIHSVKSRGTSGKLKLWISCCRCGSKMHLVGECPGVDTARASRWALKSLDPSQIVNLSLETGTRKREQEVENFGIRPPGGLQIKGRAAQRQAQAAEAERRRMIYTDDESEEEFRRQPPPPPRGDQYRPSAGSRYDRFEAPSNSYRPPKNSFYATDSFGRPRPRSRSPRDDPSDYVDDRRRRRSPPTADSWRPAEFARRREPSPPRGRHPQPKPPKAPTITKPNIQVRLPTRLTPTRDTSRNVPGHIAAKSTQFGGDSAPSSNPESSGKASNKKKKKNKKPGKNIKAGKPS